MYDSYDQMIFSLDPLPLDHNGAPYTRAQLQIKWINENFRNPYLDEPASNCLGLLYCVNFTTEMHDSDVCAAKFENKGALHTGPEIRIQCRSQQTALPLHGQAEALIRIWHDCLLRAVSNFTRDHMDPDLRIPPTDPVSVPVWSAQ